MNMNFALARNWWSLVIRGIVAILVGCATFAWPGITVAMLVFLFAGYALVDGVTNLVGAFRAVAARERWGALLFEGILGIIAAVVTIMWPAITALSLVYIIAAWAILTGAAEIGAAVRLRKIITGEWFLALCGILSIAFGVMIIIAPLAGALAIALWFGIYAIVFGTLLTLLGFRLRHLSRGGFEHLPMPAH